MKLIITGITTMLFVISIIFGLATTSYSADRSDIGKLLGFAIEQKFDNLTEEEYIVHNYEGTDIVKYVSFYSKEQLSILEDYDYNMHYLHISVQKGFYKLTIVIKEVKNSTSPDSRTYTQWSMGDDDVDGVVDRHFKDFVIVMENFGGEEGYDIKLFPRYPDGMLNYKWFNPLREEVQIYFDKEVKYWLEKLLEGQ